MIRLITLLAVLVLSLAACNDKQEARLPTPVEVGSEDTGFICGMLISDHAGPKGQIYVASHDYPLWFSSVRDAIAYIRMPDRPDDIRVVYVNDMGKAESWSEQGAGNWIVAEKAFFVIGSEMKGGMGQPEAVPFGDEAKAGQFADEHGGKVLRLADIPDSYVLSPTDEAAMSDMVGMDDDTMKGMSNATEQQ